MHCADLEKILARPVEGVLDGGRPVTGITADSRRVKPGMVFVAVSGGSVDGHRYIRDAVDAGCVCVVKSDARCRVHGCPAFTVDDSRQALGLLAAAWYGEPAGEMTLVALTGTNGKTTTSWLLESILLQAGYRVGVIGTVNYRYRDLSGARVLRPAPLTTPDPLRLQALLREMADQGVSHVLIEASSHALSQQRLAGVRCQVALFTNLSRDHLDYHRNMEEYFQAKKRLFTHHLVDRGTAVLVVSSRGAETALRLRRELSRVRCLEAGTLDRCDVRVRSLESSLEGSRCRIGFASGEVEVRLPLVGEHNLENMAGAAGAASALGVDPETIGRGLSGVEQVPGRLERVRLAVEDGEEPRVFVDYAHTPDGLARVLAALRPLCPGRLICVFGCGGDRDRGKRPEMGLVAGQGADLVVVTSDNPRSEQPEAIIEEIRPGLEQAGCHCLARDEQGESDTPPRRACLVVPDRARAIALACSLAGGDDLVLVAGKGHEQVQIQGRKKIFFDDRLQVQEALAAWTVPRLLRATGGHLLRSTGSRRLGRVRTDSRKVEAGDVFVALPGDRFDGHDFVSEVCDRGAGAVLVSRKVGRASGETALIGVEDTLVALGDLAAHRRRLLARNLVVMGITGSSGKTTVKEMTAAICTGAADRGSEQVLRTRGNFNNLVGLPLSLLPLQPGHRWAILEMGMNRPGEIARLTEILDPDIALINNIQPVHLEGVGDIEGVAAAKGELFAGLRPDARKVVNLDDPLVRDLARKSPGDSLGFAVTPAGRRRGPEVKITRGVSRGENGVRFTLHLGQWQERITVPVFGLHNLHNCAAAAALAYAASIVPEVIARGLVGFTGVDGRMQLMRMPGGLRVVNDCYNANPASMRAALESVATFGRNCLRVAALGDMLELGPEGPFLHRSVGRLVAGLGYDLLAVTGDLGREIAAGAREEGMARERIRECSSPVEIADWLYHLLISGRLGEDDWLLVKGSRGMHMEILLAELQNRFDPARKEM